MAPLAPYPWLLAAAITLDVFLGDPVYPYHPVRLIGATLTKIEQILLKMQLDGYAGGTILLIVLNAIWIGATTLLIRNLPKTPAIALHLFLLYSLLALRDLLKHGYAVERAAARNNQEAARHAISQLVGRDTSQMDSRACRRAAIESLSENLTDGFISPILWYALLGLPGLILFKVISTMDSMVGYKTDRYLKFGWAGARADDLMNWIPARLTYLLLTLVALAIPGCNARKALRVGWQQHSIVPGPNSGWSEAATAGAINRRLIGPIFAQGELVTELWLGDPRDPPAGLDGDFRRAAHLNLATGILASLIAIAALLWL